MEITPSEHVTVRFILQTKLDSFAPNSEVFIVGNIAELGFWSAKDKLKMEQVSDARFEASIIIPKNIKNIIEYKYAYIGPNDTKLNGEQGENRHIRLANSSLLQIQDQYRDGVQRDVSDILAVDKIFGRRSEPKVDLEVPQSNFILLKFVVSAATSPGQQIFVCGNCPQLGDSLVNKAVEMKYTYPNWEIDVYVPRSSFPIEYKYHTIRSKGKNAKRSDSPSEIGPNIQIHLPASLDSNSPCVVHLNDVYRYREEPILGITTSPGELKMLIDEAKFSNCQISDLVYEEDGKLVVCSFGALYTASKCQRAVKKIKNLAMFSTQDSFEFEYASEALMDPESSVREIHLDPKSQHVTPAKIEIFSNILRKNYNITTLDISHSMLDLSHVKWNVDWLLAGLAKNEFPRISTLSFRTFRVSTDHMPHIINALKNNQSTLTSLKLNSYIVDMQKLCQALQINTTLKQFYLSIQIISESDSELFAQTINSKKKTMSCRFTLTNQHDIRPAVKLIGLLRELNFSANDITQEVFNEIISALKENSTMQKFSLKVKGLNPLPAEHTNQLINTLFETNWNLIACQISFNYRSLLAPEIFEEKLARNRQHQKQAHETTIILLYTLARSKGALDMLPMEVWLHIFSLIRVIGYDYCFIFDELLKDNTIRKF